MKSTIGWILAIIFGLIFLLVLPGLWMMGRFWTGGYGGMMGGPGMMGGGYTFMHPFGWGGMLIGWLIPVGVIVLLVIGAVALVNNLNRSGSPISRTCPNCSKPAQADWNTCPYCGQKLS
jgi:hypothetical protein